jgi:hypothetical protein
VAELPRQRPDGLRLGRRWRHRLVKRAALAAFLVGLVAAACAAPRPSAVKAISIDAPAVVPQFVACQASAVALGPGSWNIVVGQNCPPPPYPVTSYATIDSSSTGNPTCPQVDVALASTPCAAWSGSSVSLTAAPTPHGYIPFPYTLQLNFPAGTPPRMSITYDCAHVDVAAGVTVVIGNAGPGPFFSYCAGAVPGTP